LQPPEEVAREVFRLALPAPFEVGPVNCYLLRREEPALIDTGPKTDEAWSALRAGLSALGVEPRALRHIFATHAHLDHHGNLARLAEMAPRAAIWVHEDDAHQVFEYRESIEEKAGGVLDLARFWGFPEEALGLVEKTYLGFKKFGDSLSRKAWRPIRGEEQEIVLGATRLCAIHAPGHTEGLVCLFLDEKGGVLFSNDHVLERITPNPTVYLPPYRGQRTGLADYIASLRRLRGVPAATVLPGHGPPFFGLARRIDEILAHHCERKEAIAGILARDRRRWTVMELVLEHWPRLSPNQYYLACREMHGHLDLLEADGRLRRETEDGVGRFALAAGDRS
jgi:glyoxylase-like metal-dependent hydrolase (beta-lactamase superfamily II)